MSSTRRSTRWWWGMTLIGGACVALLWLATHLLRGGWPAADAVSPPLASNGAATTSPLLAEPSAVRLPVAADTRDVVPTVEPEPARESTPAGSPSTELEAKYSGMSDHELQIRLAELKFAYELAKNAVVQQRFDDELFYSEPVSPAGRSPREPSPPRQDELFHLEIRVPAEGGPVRLWTYLSEAEYPELHELKRELDWLSRRVRD